MTRTFRTRITGRACENFGAVDYTITDTITERDGGLEVTAHAYGTSEGERVDSKSTKFYPGAAMESAASYRLTHGYTEVRS